MFDNIMTNKYLIAALAIALVVVLFMYLQKDSCRLEKMDSVKLHTKKHYDKPWADTEEDYYDPYDKYKKVDNDIDKLINKYNPEQQRRKGAAFDDDRKSKHQIFSERSIDKIERRLNEYMDKQYPGNDFDIFVNKSRKM